MSCYACRFRDLCHYEMANLRIDQFFVTEAKCEKYLWLDRISEIIVDRAPMLVLQVHIVLLVKLGEDLPRHLTYDWKCIFVVEDVWYAEGDINHYYRCDDHCAEGTKSRPQLVLAIEGKLDLTAKDIDVETVVNNCIM